MENTAKDTNLWEIEKRNERREMLRQPVLMIVVASVLFFLLLFSFYPLLQIFIKIVWSDGWDFSILKSTFSSAYFWTAFFNSIQLGLITASISTFVGFLFAYAVTRSNMSWQAEGSLHKERRTARQI